MSAARPGWETQRLAAAHPGTRVVGLDHNPALIAAARARVPGGHPESVCADLTDAVLPAGSVDVVRAERVLMYVADLTAARTPGRAGYPEIRAVFTGLLTTARRA